MTALTDNLALGSAVAFLGAVEVAPERYAYNSTRDNVNPRYTLFSLRLEDDGEYHIFANVRVLAAWWSPKKRFAFYCNEPFAGPVWNKRANPCGALNIMGAGKYSALPHITPCSKCGITRPQSYVTVDLNTGEEILIADDGTTSIETNVDVEQPRIMSVHLNPSEKKRGEET